MQLSLPYHINLFTKYLYENERYKTETNLFTNINNNTAPFASITWYQKEPLVCVVYSHCPTNDSYNKCIHTCCCLPCSYVTKPFGILQSVSKSQNVCISFRHSKKLIAFLSEKFVVKFPDFKIFRFNKKVII